MSETKKQRKKKSLRARFRSVIRRRLVSGLLVVVPLGLTAFIVQFLYDLTAGRLSPVIRPLFNPLPDYVIPGVSILFMVVVLYGVGLVASVVLGKQLIGLVEAILRRIPLVKTVYGASKQVVETLSFQDGSSNFESVVVVDFPKPGMKSIAFVTGRVTLEDVIDGSIQEHYRVFVPTTPNPTSGYFELVPADAVENPGISVEEAVKMVMSGGLVTPDSFDMQPIAPAAHGESDNGEGTH